MSNGLVKKMAPFWLFQLGIRDVVISPQNTGSVSMKGNPNQKSRNCHMVYSGGSYSNRPFSLFHLRERAEKITHIKISKKWRRGQEFSRYIFSPSLKGEKENAIGKRDTPFFAQKAALENGAHILLTEAEKSRLPRGQSGGCQPEEGKKDRRLNDYLTLAQNGTQSQSKKKGDLSNRHLSQ